MNLLMASVLLLVMLVFQPTLIYGSKGLASGSLRSITGNGKKHSALSKTASLVMEMESGDIFVRRARGANAPAEAGGTATSNVGGGGIGGSGKRGKNNNKKSNKNTAAEQTPSSVSASATATSLGRKHLDKKVNNQQQHGNNENNSNNRNNKRKQQQLLKSQQHQNHGKRNGGGAGNKAAAAAERTSNDEKSHSTCRYAKSAWSECDAKTNSKTRTLTLKKGESNCLPTRTVEKKCKKACRYEKGAWSECTDGQMERQDKLKTMGSIDTSSCEAVRSVNRKCNPAGASKGAKSANKERKNKDKASRRAQQQQQA